MRSRAYQFNRADFAFEAFDTEIVILNLKSGTYYTLGGCALDFWDSLIASLSIAMIADALAERYNVAIEPLREDLGGLVAFLLEEGILSEAQPLDRDAALAPEGAATEYQPPLFEKYADMEDLLTLDPIHDVDPEKGWPHYRVD